ncbi:transmembrane reductase CYB561D2 isoform X2 [Ptiloglossa arizonensis]|uniref:transmembrane reductase CYB561D2 isoform X2 n=1 Tax=Ptiloglossa arizonensis TaxID=3350558 RepID=UPI003FA10A72
MAEISSYPLKSITVEAPSVDSLNTSTDMQPLDTKRSVYTICVITADLVNHILVIFMTVFLLYYSMRSFSVMDLHVTLCTLGYVLLMSEAIVVLAGESILTNFLTRRAKRHIHWILQVLGLVCIIGGVVNHTYFLSFSRIPTLDRSARPPVKGRSCPLRNLATDRHQVFTLTQA